MVKKVKNFIIAILILNVLWYLTAVNINKDILPNPLAVYQVLPELLKSSNVGLDIYASLYRIFWGLISATAIGIILGVVLARSKNFAKIADPILYFLYPIPKISLLPILMLFLGLGEVSKIGMLFLANVFQVIISVRDQVKQVPESYYRNLQVLNANNWDLFRYVTWPASLSGVFSAMRIELSASFAILFMTEVYGTQYGLGYYIMDEWSKMEYLQMYGGIIILSIIAFIIFIGIDLCDHHFNKWRKNK